MSRLFLQRSSAPPFGGGVDQWDSVGRSSSSSSSSSNNNNNKKKNPAHQQRRSKSTEPHVTFEPKLLDDEDEDEDGDGDEGYAKYSGIDNFSNGQRAMNTALALMEAKREAELNKSQLILLKERSWAEQQALRKQAEDERIVQQRIQTDLNLAMINVEKLKREKEDVQRELDRVKTELRIVTASRIDLPKEKKENSTESHQISEIYKVIEEKDKHIANLEKLVQQLTVGKASFVERPASAIREATKLRSDNRKMERELTDLRIRKDEETKQLQALTELIERAERYAQRVEFENDDVKLQNSKLQDQIDQFYIQVPASPGGTPCPLWDDEARIPDENNYVAIPRWHRNRDKLVQRIKQESMQIQSERLKADAYWAWKDIIVAKSEIKKKNAVNAPVMEDENALRIKKLMQEAKEKDEQIWSMQRLLQAGAGIAALAPPRGSTPGTAGTNVTATTAVSSVSTASAAAILNAPEGEANNKGEEELSLDAIEKKEQLDRTQKLLQEAQERVKAVKDLRFKRIVQRRNHALQQKIFYLLACYSNMSKRINAVASQGSIALKRNVITQAFDAWAMNVSPVMTAYNELEKMTEKFSDVQEVLEKHEATILQLQNDLEKAEKREINVNQHLLDARQTIETLDNQLSSTEKRHEKILADQKNKLQAELDESLTIFLARLEAKDKECSRLRQELAASGGLQSVFHEKELQYKSQISVLTDQAELLHQRLNSTIDENEEIKRELETVSEEAYKARVEARSATEKLRTEIIELQVQLDEHRKTIESSNILRVALEDRLKSQTDDVRSLTIQVTTLESSLQTMEADLEAKRMALLVDGEAQTELSGKLKLETSSHSQKQHQKASGNNKNVDDTTASTTTTTATTTPSSPAASNTKKAVKKTNAEGKRVVMVKKKKPTSETGHDDSNNFGSKTIVKKKKKVQKKKEEAEEEEEEGGGGESGNEGEERKEQERTSRRRRKKKSKDKSEGESATSSQDEASSDNGTSTLDDKSSLAEKEERRRRRRERREKRREKRRKRREERRARRRAERGEGEDKDDGEEEEEEEERKKERRKQKKSSRTESSSDGGAAFEEEDDEEYDEEAEVEDGEEEEEEEEEEEDNDDEEYEVEDGEEEYEDEDDDEEEEEEVLSTADLESLGDTDIEDQLKDLEEEIARMKPARIDGSNLRVMREQVAQYTKELANMRIRAGDAEARLEEVEAIAKQIRESELTLKLTLAEREAQIDELELQGKKWLDKLTAAEGKFDAAEEQLRLAQLRLAQLEKELEAGKQKTVELETSLEGSETKVADLTVARNELEGQVERLKSKLQAEKDLFQGQIAEFDKLLERQTNELRQIVTTSGTKALEMVEFQSEQSNQKDTIKSLQEKLMETERTLQKSSTDWKRRTEETRSELDTVTSKAKEAEETVLLLRKRLETRESELGVTRRQLATAEALAASRQGHTAEAFSGEMKKLTNQLMDLEQQLEAALAIKVELEAAHTTIQTMNEEMKETKKRTESVDELIKQKDQEIANANASVQFAVSKAMREAEQQRRLAGIEETSQTDFKDPRHTAADALFANRTKKLLLCSFGHWSQRTKQAYEAFRLWLNMSKQLRIRSLHHREIRILTSLHNKELTNKKSKKKELSKKASASELANLPPGSPPQELTALTSSISSERPWTAATQASGTDILLPTPAAKRPVVPPIQLSLVTSIASHVNAIGQAHNKMMPSKSYDHFRKEVRDAALKATNAAVLKKTAPKSPSPTNRHPQDDNASQAFPQWRDVTDHRPIPVNELKHRPRLPQGLDMYLPPALRALRRKPPALGFAKSTPPLPRPKSSIKNHKTRQSKHHASEKLKMDSSRLDADDDDIMDGDEQDAEALLSDNQSNEYCVHQQASLHAQDVIQQIVSRTLRNYVTLTASQQVSRTLDRVVQEAVARTMQNYSHPSQTYGTLRSSRRSSRSSRRPSSSKSASTVRTLLLLLPPPPAPQSWHPVVANDLAKSIVASVFEDVLGDVEEQGTAVQNNPAVDIESTVLTLFHEIKQISSSTNMGSDTKLPSNQANSIADQVLHHVVDDVVKKLLSAPGPVSHRSHGSRASSIVSSTASSKELESARREALQSVAQLIMGTEQDPKNELEITMDEILAIAVIQGSVDDVHHALSSGAKVGLRDENNFTALHRACCFGDKEIALTMVKTIMEMDPGAYEFLVAPGVGNEATPFMVAAMSDNLELVRYLMTLPNPAVIVQPCATLDTALHLAVYGSSVEMIQELLAIGLDPMQANSYGETPFDVATDRGNSEILQLLHEYLQQA